VGEVGVGKGYDCAKCGGGSGVVSRVFGRVCCLATVHFMHFTVRAHKADKAQTAKKRLLVKKLPPVLSFQLKVSSVQSHVSPRTNDP
jgi:hypothetical protein